MAVSNPHTGTDLIFFIWNLEPDRQQHQRQQHYCWTLSPFSFFPSFPPSLPPSLPPSSFPKTGINRKLNKKKWSSVVVRVCVHTLTHTLSLPAQYTFTLLFTSPPLFIHFRQLYTHFGLPQVLLFRHCWVPSLLLSQSPGVYTVVDTHSYLFALSFSFTFSPIQTFFFLNTTSFSHFLFHS